MTRPDAGGSQRPDQQARAAAAMSGAVDLSALKARAESAPASGEASTEGAQARAASGEHVVEITEENFQAEVLERSTTLPVVVDLWATWCGPCKQLSPVLERLAAEFRGAWILATVDVDANPRIAQAFGVQSIPTVVALASGQPVDAFSGAQPEPQLRDWLHQLLDALRERMPAIAEVEQRDPGEQDVPVGHSGADDAAGQGEAAEEAVVPQWQLDAEAAMDSGDLAGAIAAYQAHLAEQPDDGEAKLALRQLQLAHRAEQADPQALQRAAESPGDLDAQFEAADLELASQQASAAFQRLIDLVRRTGGPERDRARAHLLELFELFPADDDAVVGARRALASALF